MFGFYELIFNFVAGRIDVIRHHEIVFTGFFGFGKAFAEVLYATFECIDVGLSGSFLFTFASGFSVTVFLSALIFVLFFHSLYGSFIDTVFFESSRHRYQAVHNLSGEAAQFASLCTQHFGVVGSHHEEFLAAATVALSVDDILAEGDSLVGKTVTASRHSLTMQKRNRRI